jgi:hypothetical protein
MGGEGVTGGAAKRLRRWPLTEWVMCWRAVAKVSLARRTVVARVMWRRDLAKTAHVVQRRMIAKVFGILLVRDAGELGVLR